MEDGMDEDKLYPARKRSVEDLAKEMCRASHNNPDDLVYMGEPVRYFTPKGIVHGVPNNIVPLWMMFLGAAWSALHCFERMHD
jgi:hypothetical protein